MPAEELEKRILEQSLRASHLRFLRADLARMLLVTKAWTKLGFVRLGDYSRERLGLAARTIEEHARVASAAERRPETLLAFLDGELSWTQLRLLCSVDGTQKEEQWLEFARTNDTRALAAKVVARAAPAREATRGRIPFSVRVSREGRRLWRAVSELAERSAGSRLDASQVLELVAAEVSGGAPRPSQGAARKDSEADFPANGPAKDSAARSADDQTDDQTDGPAESRDAGPVFVELVPGQPNPPWFQPDPELAAFLAELQREQAEGRAQEPRPSYSELLSRIRERRGELVDREKLASIELPRRGQSASERLEAMFDQHEYRDPRAIDARLRTVSRAIQVIDSEIGPLLREALERKLHRSFGYARFSEYVEMRLDLCSRKAWTLIALERAIVRGLPELADAYRSGRLSALAATVVLPVLGARHGAAWVGRAREVTLRRLEAEVAWALDRRDAASGAEAFEAPAPPPADIDLSVDAGGLEMDRVQMRAHGEASTPASGGVTLHFSVEEDVAMLAEEVMLRVRRGSEPRGRAFERMLALALLEWTAAPRHRDPIFERDGWRCAVPCCTSRRNLQDHHIVFRSRGGGNARDNRVSLCAAHHLHGVHAGRIRAEGRAPNDIFWEIGCPWDGGAPLMRLVGDRYL